jgi:hypothetical protein
VKQANWDQIGSLPKTNISCNFFGLLAYIKVCFIVVFYTVITLFGSWNIATPTMDIKKKGGVNKEEQSAPRDGYLARNRTVLRIRERLAGAGRGGCERYEGA